jgi:hypothetical protein
MAKRFKKRGDEDDIYNEEDWDKTETRRVIKGRWKMYMPFVVLGTLLLGIVFAAVFFIFSPRIGEVIKDREKDGTTSFSDRATAFKVLTFMEERKVSEAITLAESIVDRQIPGIERNIAMQIQQKPEEVRRNLDAYICNWINIAHAAETQGAGARRKGVPSDLTSETMVMFLCDYADYRARNFIPPPREVNDEMLGRVFLLAAHEKKTRLAKRAEK